MRDQPRSHLQDIPSPKKVEHKRLNSADAVKRSKVFSESDIGERRTPAKGVPVSFGYVKKSSAHPTAHQMGGGDINKRMDHSVVNGKSLNYKTANVASVPKLIQDQQDNSAMAMTNSNRSLERPKTRLKVSGGTQTDMGDTPRTITPKASQYKSSTLATLSLNGHQTYSSYSDSEYQTTNGVVDGVKLLPTGHSTNPNAGKVNSQTTFKSYSLTAPIANQLSSNIRERLLLNGTQSLPKSPLNQIKGKISYKHLFFAHSLTILLIVFIGTLKVLKINAKHMPILPLICLLALAN